MNQKPYLTQTLWSGNGRRDALLCLGIFLQHTVGPSDSDRTADTMPWTSPYADSVTDFLGVPLHRLTLEQLLECFDSALDSQGPLHFAYLNVAVSNQAAQDPDLLRALRRADLVYVDGFGIRLGLWLLGKSCPPRTTAGDFAVKVAELCARKGKSIGLLGGTPGAALRLGEEWTRRFPDLRIDLVCDGYEELTNETLWRRRLEANPPDLLLVGLGVPKQEEWIEKCRNDFGVTLYWSVGALFEYDVGSLKRSPAWMRACGLEWFYRLWTEPGRLWKRYLIGNPRFLLRCLSSRLRGREETC